MSNLGLGQIDLMQFHVWEDDWVENEEWQRTVEDLKREGKVHAFGISVNRNEPRNVLKTLHTGLIDSVQVIYNIFEQGPEDALFPLCEELGVAVIARVPFDEGTLTGNITRESVFEEGDWRKRYFTPENLEASVSRAEALSKDVPEGMTMAELALRFILHHPAVSTVIPGMRQAAHVHSNIASSDDFTLDDELIKTLRKHRWDRNSSI